MIRSIADSQGNDRLKKEWNELRSKLKLDLSSNYKDPLLPRRTQTYD